MGSNGSIQCLIDEINVAFKQTVLGKGIGLWEAQAIDDYEPKDVQRQCRAKDEKIHWQKLTSEALQRCHSSLSFFDADGMRFHLPAFMVASLRNEVDDPIFHLTHLDDYARSKLTRLNIAQKQAIASYLQWCLLQDEYEFDHPMIKRALADYWVTP